MPEQSDELLRVAREQTWIVYAKKTFAGPKQVLEYLGRYTRRIAISNHRIKGIKDGQVTFTYKDQQSENRAAKMRLSAGELFLRFLLHVLPFRLMKIRYYGFLANSCKWKAVLLIRRLIGKEIRVWQVGKETTQE